MILSKTCDHALRAALYIVKEKKREYVPIKEIADQLDISFHFLTKILQILTQQGILHSYKGPNGGVALVRPASEISLLDIVTAVDGPHWLQGCLLGLLQCSDDHPCPIHDQWQPIRDRLYLLFAKTTLKQLADKVVRDGYRLTDRMEETNIIKAGGHYKPWHAK